MANSPHSVLVVEDNTDLQNLLTINLTDDGYIVHKAENGIAALDLYRNHKPDLIILDIMLPKLDGFDVCREIRREDKITPILMLTAKAEEIDKVLGLELGADDYMTKPFSIREFLARVKAIFRRMSANKNERQSKSEILEFDRLCIDTGKRKVTINKKLIDLTSKEYELLTLFFKNPGKAFSRDELLTSVWGYSYEGYSHTVNSHINRLRTKIEADPSEPHYIRTVWGVGYRFADREESRIHA